MFGLHDSSTSCFHAPGSRQDWASGPKWIAIQMVDQFCCLNHPHQMFASPQVKTSLSHTQVPVWGVWGTFTSTPSCSLSCNLDSSSHLCLHLRDHPSSSARTHHNLSKLSTPKACSAMSRPTVERSNSNLSRVARVPRSEVAREGEGEGCSPQRYDIFRSKDGGFDGFRNDSNVR